MQSCRMGTTLQGDLQGQPLRVLAKPPAELPTMFRRRLTKQPVSRGQAMVEFALILPLIALLLVMAIDFGRVFFGWVSLTNAARIGANYAGYTPDLLSDSDKRDEYIALISDHIAGCDLDPVDTDDPAYDPTFADGNGDDDGVNQDWGDLVTVSIRCELELITPLAGAIVGSRVPMAAEAVFPIREGSFAGPGGGASSPPTPTCTLSYLPDLLNRTVADARAKWLAEGFLAANFAVNPDLDDNLVNSQTFTPNAAVQDCVDPTGQSVSLTTVAPPPCPSGEAQVPDLIGLTVADAKVAWAALFSGDFNPSNAVDDKTVLTQTTDPVTSPPINGCLEVDAEVTITYGDPPPTPCDVPNMIGLTWAAAQSAWIDNGFTVALTYQGNNTKTVKEQNPSHPGTVSCDVVGWVKF
jgi:beta-lactam-binding protein with PASTA domain/Flp pilus assembly pilin Flp